MTAEKTLRAKLIQFFNSFFLDTWGPDSERNVWLIKSLLKNLHIYTLSAKFCNEDLWSRTQIYKPHSSLISALNLFRS